MSSKEKVLAIRPEALCRWSKVTTHTGTSHIYWIGDRLWAYKSYSDAEHTEPEAWASAYKYLTK
jgi:hypothetical protein